MKTLLFITAMLLALPVTGGFAQKPEEDDGPVGIFPSRSEYYEFMGGAKQAAYGENGSPELRAMIPLLNDIALNKPVGWSAHEYGSEASTLGLLSDADVRADLEMVDDQYEQLRNLNSEIQQRAAEQLRGIDFKDSENLLKQIRGIRDRANHELNSVLLPHQLQRLQQIRMQSQLRRRSLVEILTSDPLKSDLDITDNQSNELRLAEKEIEEDLQKQIAKLREKARERLLSTLEPAQKKRVEELIGDTFDSSQSSLARSPESPEGRKKSVRQRQE